MPLSRSLALQNPPVQVLAPAADAAGRTGAWIHAHMAAKYAIVFTVAQGNAATILISLLQAQDNAGTGSKAGPTCKIFADTNTGSSDALVAQTDGSTFTTDAGTNNKIVIIEFDAAQLDLANGFNHFTISTGASNAANVTQAVVVPEGFRYAQLTVPTQTD